MQNPSDGVTPDIRLELSWTNWMVQRRKKRRNDSAKAPNESGGFLQMSTRKFRAGFFMTYCW